MYSRPKADETEEDILKLQEEFLKHASGKEFTPAAKLVKDERDDTKNEVQPSQHFDVSPQAQIANTFESVPSNINIGNIVEKTGTYSAPPPSFAHKKGFPQAKRRDPSLSGSKGSIFSQQMKRLKKDTTPMELDTNVINVQNIIIKENQPSSTSRASNTAKHQPMDTDPPETDISKQSYIVTGGEKEEIHKQNVELLQQMTQAEILEEQERLLSTMDPAIITFLKAKRTNVNESRTVSIAEQNKAAESITVEDVEASKELLSLPESEKWLNFDSVETGKLAWMKNVDIPKYEKGKAYEARFDFDGWLLPFTGPGIDETNRSLYHHGDEPGRPGYTLQELFQLCRSSVNQQKVVALNAIANILALQQSGIYDDVIEIPLEQIFFVLRFCLDDNTPAVLNASIKAIRNLFFYPIDETCLDNLLGFGLGMIQPILAIDNSEIDDDNTVNDQQLAETNLIKCLARTDILKRIRYILNTIKPAVETLVYCMEILIRMARDSDFIVKQLHKCDSLLSSVIAHFVPKTLQVDNLQSAYGCPLVQAIKLLRILSARNRNFAIELINRYSILELLSSYMSNEGFSTNSNGLKLQIESLHLWCVFAHYGLGLDYLKELEPILQRMLDFHARNTNVQPSTSYVIQGHIAALLNLLAEAFKINYSNMEPYMPLLNDLAILKWTTQFGDLEEFTCGKLQIITALLRCATYMCKYKPGVAADVIETLVLNLLNSKGFNVVTSNIRVGSNLLNNLEAHKTSANLKSVEAAVWKASDHIVPALQTNSCLTFLNVLSEFIECCHSPQVKLAFMRHNNLNKYLKHIKNAPSYNLVSNWFTRLESQLIMNILKVAVSLQRNLDTSMFYEIAVKCLSIFTSEQEFVLSNIVFSPSFYPCETLMDNLEINEPNELLKTALNNLNNVLSVYAQVLNLKTERQSNLCVDLNSGNVMPVDWIYSPIILLYSNQQQNKQGVTEDQQSFIVTNCLRWIYIYEIYFPSLAKLINPTDRFCRIACTFLGSDSLFLIPEIHSLLEACLKYILASNERNINFSKPIQGLNNFQDFYTQLLEQYQGVSYGDVLFGNFILLPLIQRHDVKYRKVLWSEYAGILQIFNVTAEQVICPVELFLNPPETDVSLLKCYRKALVMGLIPKQSFLYQIANHHVEAFIARKKENKT